MKKTKRKNPASGSRATTISLLLLVLLTFLVYAGTLRNGFIWDDDDYITKNPLLTQPGGLGRIWTSFYHPEYNREVSTPQYYPLVFSTFYLEHKLWGLKPTGYHATNVIIHAANAVLLFFLLRRLGISSGVAWVTAALFALHPVQVESVAWATERKNVLSTFFYFSSFIAFLIHDDTGRRRHLVASLFFFLLALLSKTVALTLPAAMLLALYLRGRERPWHAARWVIPHFVLGLGMGLLTSVVERYRVGAQGPEWDLSFWQRLIIASRAVWFYFGKLAFPHPLAFFYVRWQVNAVSPVAWLPVLGLILAVLAAWFLRKQLGRAPVFCAVCFVVTLSPALGFINFYPMRYSFVADHFQYLADWSMILLLVLAGKWLLEQLFHHEQRATAAALVSATVLLVAGRLTWEQAKNYRDLETLWSRTIAANPAAWLAHNNLGVLLSQRSEFVEAMDHYRKTIEYNPRYAEAYNNLGVDLCMVGRTSEAIEYYLKAIGLKKDYFEAMYNLGAAYAAVGRDDDARKTLAEVVRLKPDYAAAHYNLALVLSRMGRYAEAVHYYEKDLQLNPLHIEGHYNLGVTYALLDRNQLAEKQLQRAIELRPDYIEAHAQLGQLYEKEGKLPQAVMHYEKVVQLAPDSAEAHQQLALAYEKTGDYQLAQEQRERARELGMDGPEE